MPNELVALGGAFLAAGFLGRIGQRIGLPTIPFFMAAGIITGPHTPGFVLVEDPDALEVFAAVGLVMLLFHLGLEFSLKDLVGGGKKMLAAGGVYLLLNIGGGLALGFALGWGSREALVIAGAVGISSSAIVTKLVVELRRLANRETRMILGIIVVEDIFLALYLAFLQPVLGGAESTVDAVLQFGRAVGFLVVLFAVARFGAHLVSRMVSGADDEPLTVIFVGLAIFVAGVAEEVGVSDAIGAFMVGLILAETTAAGRIERLVLPLRDAFAAVFFFAFGLSIDPGAIAGVVRPVIVAVLLTLALNLVAGWIAARMQGFGRREGMNAGLTLLGRGEFSLILATLAAAAGLDSRIGPFVALYVLVLAITGPIFASRSDSLARLLPRRTPAGPHDRATSTSEPRTPI
ncbi:MAG: cation:proton antiporter [Actinomycetota bacterium]